MNKNERFKFINQRKLIGDDLKDSISYNGEYKDVKTTIELIEYDKSTLSKKSVSNVLNSKNNENVTWYNITGLNNPNLINDIRRQFDIHYIDMEEIIHVSQWSKIEQRQEYKIAVLKMIRNVEKEFIYEHLVIFHKDNMIITFQETEGDVFDILRDRINDSNSIIRDNNSEYLFYSLIDSVIDQYFVVVQSLYNDFTALESNILKKNTKGNEDDIYRVRKELLYLIHSITPIKDSFEIMIEDDDCNNSLEIYYYKDLSNRLKQISKILNAYKEMIDGIYEIHISNITNRTNKTMMILTIFSATFIPLSFLTGVFGMNFKYMPGLNAKASFTIFVIACILLSISMLGYFKKKKWF